MKTIVIGSLNTDLVATGLKKFPKAGEHVYGKELLISPGGKSRNIADMIARLSSGDSVAMVGRTIKDKYGLWKLPISSLSEAGVNVDYVNISGPSNNQELPGIALIPVDEAGNNQIIVLPGISNSFSPEDIDRASDLFKEVGSNHGMLVLTLECPLDTTFHAIKKANKYGIRVMFDPGGVQAGDDVAKLLNLDIFFIKPNEHEANILTGVNVKDFASAKLAAQRLKEEGIRNILITAGSVGAYLFSDGIEKHIPIPKLSGGTKDETGCGDQTMATFCAYMQDGKSIEEAAEVSILAGTLQSYKDGVQPLTKDAIENTQ